MQGYAKCNNSMVSLQQRTIVEVVRMVSLNLSSFWWGSGAHTFVFITNLSIGLLFRMLTYRVSKIQVPFLKSYFVLLLGQYFQNLGVHFNPKTGDNHCITSNCI